MKRSPHRKFNREPIQRKALYKALATALIDNGRIQTTQAKAKSLSSFADRLVNRAKKGDLASRRLLLTHVGKVAVDKLMKDIGPRFKERNGGYTRVIRMGRRTSDGSPMALIEFTS